MNACPYDPDHGTLCSPCITLLYEEISLTVLSGITLAMFTFLSFMAHNVRTFHFSRRVIKLHVIPSERIMMNLLLLCLWVNEFLLIHLWRLTPVAVACPPSSVYIGTKIVTDILSILLVSIAIASQNKYIFRVNIWIPAILQTSTIYVYNMDAISRQDICWTSFVIIISVIIGVINVINIPYILMGGTRAIIGKEIQLIELGLKHSDEREYIKGGNSALSRMTEDGSSIEMDDMSGIKDKLKRYNSDSSSDYDGGIIDVPLS